MLSHSNLLEMSETEQPTNHTFQKKSGPYFYFKEISKHKQNEGKKQNVAALRCLL